MTDPTIGAVLVLFAPDTAALANLDRTRRDCPQVVAVDNTPRPDAALHDSLRAQGVDVIVNRNEGGLAGAYNRGLERLLELGCELCFLLDQDSELADGFFDRMATSAATVPDRAFLLGPRVYEIAMDRSLPADGGTPSDVPGLRTTQMLISSGSALSASAIGLLGPFHEDMVIEFLDVEYCLRAVGRGVPMYVRPDEELRQHTGAMTRHGRFFTTNHVAWRRYYLVRNECWTISEHHGRRAGLVTTVRRTLREVLVVVAYEQDKARKVVGILLGAWDGLRGRLGTFEARHRRAQHYCTRGAGTTSPAST